jgi:hypothetical protein
MNKITTSKIKTIHWGSNNPSQYFSNHMLKTVFFALGDYLCIWGVDDGLGWDICKDKGGSKYK